MNNNEMNDDQLLRYSRQIMLQQVGVEGQQKLRQAAVLVIGAGGLGCPVAMYLAAAGIGRIVLADDDRVELTNLQRQLAHTMDDIGRMKTHSLRDTLNGINPECETLSIDCRLELDQLVAVVQAANIVLDCTDNFEARFAINRACVANKKPLVSGAAIRFEGQIMAYDPEQSDSPCYECVYPDSGDIEETCSQNGVIAPLVGMIGSMQALEAIKLIAGIGQSMAGRLLILDALTMQWREMKTTVDPQCQVCGSCD